MMDIDKSRIGVSTLTWKDETVVYGIRRAAELGFAGVDIGIVPWHDFSAADLVEGGEELLASVREVLSATGIRVFSINAGSLDPQDPGFAAQAGALARFAAGVNSEQGITLGAPPKVLPDDAPVSAEEAFALMEEMIRPFAEEGVALMPETHRYQCSEDPEWMLQLVRKIPNLKITLDASHYLIQGFTIDRIAPLFPYTAHAHIRPCGTEGWETIQVPAAESSPRVGEWIEGMEESGYRGSYSFEVIEGIGLTGTEKETMEQRRRLFGF